jgi:hypothetical protein
MLTPGILVDGVVGGLASRWGTAAARLVFDNTDDGEPRRAAMDGERNGEERGSRFGIQCVLATLPAYIRHADMHIGILCSAMPILPVL